MPYDMQEKQSYTDFWLYSYDNGCKWENGIPVH